MDSTLQSLAQWRAERQIKLKRSPGNITEQQQQAVDSTAIEQENQREIEIELNL
jgi:hypothetical protein